MKFFYLKSISWSPVIVRCFLWIVISMMTEFVISTKEITADEVHKWFWLDWLRNLAGWLLPGLIAWRTFLDQSLSQHKEKQEKLNEKQAAIQDTVVGGTSG
jgi:hypothetical protein